jgi:predicted dehydrogenase
MAVSRPLIAASPNNAVSVGFVGVGGRGSYLLKLLLEMPEVNVLAVCDIDPQRLAAAQDAVAASGRPRPEGFQNWHQLLERKGIGAVVSALPQLDGTRQT